MVGWTKTKTCLQQSTLSPKSLWPETLSSPDQLVCWGMSSITSVFWDIRLRMWKTSLLPSPVNCFRTSFAISTPLKAWGRPGNNPSLPLQLRESTLLCGHLHASAMHTVHRMVSNTPPPLPPPNTYLKNSQTSGSLLWSKSLHKHLRGFLASGVKASWWYIWLTSPTRATNFFRNLTRILNSSVCNFGPGNAWLF